MYDADEIKKLEEEIARLSTVLQTQYAEVKALRLRLQQLHPGAITDTVPAKPATGFNRYPSASLESLIGLRLIHLIGIVVLVIGLSLGVKYAIDKNLISEGLRIVLAYAAGAVLYVLSARLKKQYAGFSAILFSGAMASLYFTTYGAYVYYGFLSFTVAFAVMIVLTVFTAWQALVYNRQEIALLGLVGAYGIPFLISPNRGHAETLFLYITIINLGVVFLCARRKWTLVGRPAQAISWLLFIGWAALQNDEGLKTYGPFFMVLFFVLFAVNALSPKFFMKEPVSLNASYQLLINNLAFYIAALYVFGYTFTNSTIAVITILFSLLAALQAGYFYRVKEATATRLVAGYALILFIIFIGFQWAGITVTLLWLLTAVVLFIGGVKFKSTPVRMSAIGLIGITLVKLVLLDSLVFTTLQKVIAYLVLGVLLLLVSFFYQKTSPPTPLQQVGEGSR